MQFKPMISAGLAAALLFASAAAPASAHGAIAKEVVWFDENYVEVGRTFHYCDGHLGYEGNPEFALFQQVYYYSCNQGAGG